MKILFEPKTLKEKSIIKSIENIENACNDAIKIFNNKKNKYSVKIVLNKE